MALRTHNGLPIALEMELRTHNALPIALEMELRTHNALPITLEMELRTRNPIFHGVHPSISQPASTLQRIGSRSFPKLSYF